MRFPGRCCGLWRIKAEIAEVGAVWYKVTRHGHEMSRAHDPVQLCVSINPLTLLFVVGEGKWIDRTLAQLVRTGPREIQLPLDNRTSQCESWRKSPNPAKVTASDTHFRCRIVQLILPLVSSPAS